jgi:hypothetical protein
VWTNRAYRYRDRVGNKNHVDHTYAPFAHTPAVNRQPSITRPLTPFGCLFSFKKNQLQNRNKHPIARKQIPPKPPKFALAKSRKIPHSCTPFEPKNRHLKVAPLRRISVAP